MYRLASYTKDDLLMTEIPKFELGHKVADF